MKSSFRIAGIAVLALATATAAPAAPKKAAAKAPAIDATLMRQMVQRLASDEFEGRAPSTRTEPKVLNYIISQFKAAGLKPGNKGSWLQAVPTVEVTASNASALTVTGAGAPLSFRFGDDYVAGSYRAVPKTDIKDAELVFVGYGINAPELGWNDYAGLDMKGKIAVILINDPDYAMETQGGLFKGRRMTYYGRWTYKFEEAARQGAAGALIIHDTFPAAYGWNVVNSSWTGAQYYVQSANNGMDQTEANGWIQKPVAEKIFSTAGKDLAALTASAKEKGFKAVPLGLKAGFSFDNAIRKSNSHNVIGVLPGKQAPNEYVLYTGHWDHLGRCTADARGDDICNGAVDNATGIAALAAIAKASAKAGPARRSQVFLAVTLEESGLLGSKYYAEHPVFPLSQTVGGVNMDALSPTGRSRNYSITGGDKSELTGIFRNVLKARGLIETPEEDAEKGYYYRSDHFPFAKQGVPMFYVERGTDLVNGGTAAGRAAEDDYRIKRYHQPSDEYSPKWDFAGILQDAEINMALGRELAMSKAWPNWHSNDEFRLIRDKSRNGK
ncbi:M28 family metallopeptidase [Novosphingobium sp. TH158]|uniref:M28 family metallopeptidase n=1 Tax=Novosphingobium sp. TH158 TaxID=2067455 RepID=UPI000C7DF669|nr:M28 family metallopeptidase [Novosphingobium sp. TH158]PLK27125.1 peptidase M28 [Novosphingobium sp. TH158]